MSHRTGLSNLKPASPYLLAFCVVIVFWTAANSFSRAFRLTSINYNEGWNVYNAQKVAEHQPLYTSTYGWTAVNYPALSFHIVAPLSRSTSDYLFTGRMLSLAGLCLSGVFAGLIVWHTTRSVLAAWLTGPFLVAVFGANAQLYVGMDDPQMLAQAFLLGGICVYLLGNRRGWALELTALLFVLGLNIKHNLLEFPLAVLLDLLLSSPRRALRFAAGGMLLAALSILLTIQIDGAAYISCLLAPRGYSLLRAISNASGALLPLLLPTLAALWMARYCWMNPSQRVLALLLFCALALNTFFIGGQGVSINAMFGSMLAIALLTGVFWAEFSTMPLGRLRLLPPDLVCVIFFAWLAIPMISSHNVRTMRHLQQSRAAEQRFAAEVAFMRQQPGPALCEDLLHCYYAGKPYLYDPFNASRFIQQGRLDPGIIVDHLRNHDYGSIQLDGSVERKLGDALAYDHFAPPILQAIQQNYHPVIESVDRVIYLPTR